MNLVMVMYKFLSAFPGLFLCTLMLVWILPDVLMPFVMNGLVLVLVQSWFWCCQWKWTSECWQIPTHTCELSVYFDVPVTLLRCCFSHSAGSGVIFGACLRSVPPKACLCYTPRSDSSNYLPGSGASKSGHWPNLLNVQRHTIVGWVHLKIDLSRGLVICNKTVAYNSFWQAMIKVKYFSYNFIICFFMTTMLNYNLVELCSIKINSEKQGKEGCALKNLFWHWLYLW